MAFEFGQPCQTLLDALRQLTGGLAGEREPENLVAADDAVRHQPDDPRGHRLGLAAAGAGDHERGSQRRLDDRGLLVRRRELAEGGRDDARRQERGGRVDGVGRQLHREALHDGHEALTAPTVWMRHSP